MNKYAKVGEIDKGEQILKKLRHLQEEIEDLKEDHAHIKKGLTEVKKAQGLEQPAKEFPAINKEYDEMKGELIWAPGCEEYLKLCKKLKQRGGMDTGQMKKVLSAWDVEKSTKQIHRDMRKMDEKLEGIEFEHAKDRQKAQSHRIKWTMDDQKTPTWLS